MVANRSKKRSLSLVDKEAAVLKDEAAIRAAEAEKSPKAPAYEIDPDIDISLQLLMTQQNLEQMRNGRYQLKLRYRVNKFSFKNEQAVEEDMKGLVVQEAAISDMEAYVAFIQAEIEKRKLESEV